MAEYLFVYGTLLPDLAPAPLRPLLAQLEPCGPARIAGQLFDLGPYPGVVLRGDDPVEGELFALPADCPLLPTLDAYESVEAGLFARRRCRARRADGGEVEAWVYEYGRGTHRRRRIESGSYRRWRRG